MDKLQRATVAILGLGGVGGAAAEAICRMGVGRIILVDSDTVDRSNLNRQLFATADMVGQSKCLAARRRLLSINPEVELSCHEQFFLPENADFLFDEQPDLILDAIDTVTAKLYLAEQCQQRGIPLVTCLGTGNRLDPAALGRHLRNRRLRLPLSAGDAPGAKEARGAEADGGLLDRAAGQGHLPRRGGEGPAQPCQLRLCAAGGRLSAGKRRVFSFYKAGVGSGGFVRGW